MHHKKKNGKRKRERFHGFRNRQSGIEQQADGRYSVCYVKHLRASLKVEEN